MSFWPQKIIFKDVLLNSLGSLIAWIIWSIIILFLIFSLSWVINIWEWFNSSKIWWQTTTIFPIVLSIIALFSTFVTSFLTYFLLNMTSPEKYKKNVIIIWQITFFSILTYFFFAPIYIFEWLIIYTNIIYVFLAHVLLLSFWVSIIIEILNNYRYVLLWIYWSFIWLFLSLSITLLIFSSFDLGYAKLISLFMLPIINFLMTFFKQTFELIYFHYNKYTNLDQLWDIFYTIENEEKELLREEEQKNSI